MPAGPQRYADNSDGHAIAWYPPLPAKPEPALPLAERVVLLEEQNQTLRQQLAASRKEAAELRRIAARQERRIGELEAVLNKIERATVRLKAG